MARLPKDGLIATGVGLNGAFQNCEHPDGLLEQDPFLVLVGTPLALLPDADAQFKSLDGWYDTGNIVYIDPEGFLFIQGRLKRFAKISGEMVSLTALEEALSGAFPQYGLRFQIAVVSRPDPDKGEMLIAATNEPRLKLDELRAAVRQKGLPNIAMPRDLRCLKDLPRLGTGKVNHRELERML